eukprot:scaffold27589_cov48-Phaeocystis_antarctica.AAC.2
MRCSGESAPRCSCPTRLSARRSSDSGSTAARYLARSRLPEAAAARWPPKAPSGISCPTSLSPASVALTCEQSAAISSGENWSRAAARLSRATACASSAAFCICTAAASTSRACTNGSCSAAVDLSRFFRVFGSESCRLPSAARSEYMSPGGLCTHVVLQPAGCGGTTLGMHGRLPLRDSCGSVDEVRRALLVGLLRPSIGQPGTVVVLERVVGISGHGVFVPPLRRLGLVGRVGGLIHELTGAVGIALLLLLCSRRQAERQAQQQQQRQQHPGCEVIAAARH